MRLEDFREPHGEKVDIPKGRSVFGTSVGAVGDLNGVQLKVFGSLSHRSKNDPSKTNNGTDVNVNKLNNVLLFPLAETTFR